MSAIAHIQADVVELLASRTAIAVALRLIGKTLRTVERTVLSERTVPGTHVRSDATIQQPLQKLPVPVRGIGSNRRGFSSLPLCEAGIWYNQPGIGAGEGTAYIAQAFRWAREADRKALLFYNEAEAEELNPKSDAIYAMVRDLRHRGVPIDGIGFQMHIFNLTPNYASIAANFARFGKLGIQIHITEMDVALPVTKDGAVMESLIWSARRAFIGRLLKFVYKLPGVLPFRPGV